MKKERKANLRSLNFRFPVGSSHHRIIAVVQRRGNRSECVTCKIFLQVQMFVVVGIRQW